MVPSGLAISQIAATAQAREAAQVGPGLGVAVAGQHPALLGAEREDVPGAREVVGDAGRVGQQPHGAGAVGGGDPGGDPLLGVDRHGEGGAVALGVALDHLLQLQPVQVGAGHRHADQAAALVHAEGDQFGGGELGGEDDVALVLPVLVVDDHDRPSGGDLPDRGLDAVQRQVLVQLTVLLDQLLGQLGGDLGDDTHAATPWGTLTDGCCDVRVRDHQERIPATTRTK
jgi:hypothetical protein